MKSEAQRSYILKATQWVVELEFNPALETHFQPLSRFSLSNDGALFIFFPNGENIGWELKGSYASPITSDVEEKKQKT